jgi:hypothetical protein
LVSKIWLQSLYLWTLWLGCSCRRCSS